MKRRLNIDLVIEYDEEDANEPVATRKMARALREFADVTEDQGAQIAEYPRTLECNGAEIYWTDEIWTKIADAPSTHKVVRLFGLLQRAIYENNVKKGFWEDKKDRNKAEMIALMHSELSEALEGLRHGNPASDKIPEFNQVEEELADTIIRILDMAQAFNYKLAAALMRKFEYNAQREHKHGKKF